jgi:GNAT superfamily N-acetyltransferase
MGADARARAGWRDGHAGLRNDTVIDIGPPRDAGEFLVSYGAGLAPLVTPAHLAAPRMRHLVARVHGQPVGCARVRLMADTAQVGAVSVVPAWRGRGVGSALTVAVSELAASLADVVWLHCSDTSRALYERLGYRHADDHALLVAE